LGNPFRIDEKLYLNLMEKMGSNLLRKDDDDKQFKKNLTLIGKRTDKLQRMIYTEPSLI
jgi:hypothetical protein